MGLGGAMVDIRDLELVPRILFATDGAITHILEAFAGEPMDPVRLSSSDVTDPAQREEFGIADHERALCRLSLLRGRTSGRAFVHSDSVVVLDRLPAPVADELVATGTSLLKLLSQRRIGTFRETTAEWEGHDGPIADRLGIPPTEVLLARTYQIVAGGQPVAWSTEHFPRTGFSCATVAAGPSEHR